jgi:hypothetical protein
MRAFACYVVSKLQRHRCPTFGALPLRTITRTNWPLHFYIYRWCHVRWWVCDQWFIPFLFSVCGVPFVVFNLWCGTSCIPNCNAYTFSFCVVDGIFFCLENLMVEALNSKVHHWVSQVIVWLCLSLFILALWSITHAMSLSLLSPLLSFFFYIFPPLNLFAVLVCGSSSSHC